MEHCVFKDCGLKRTKNRELIYNILYSHSHPLTAKEIYDSLKEYNIDLSTIYRCLNSFTNNGICNAEINDNNEKQFFLEKHGDKHIIVCVKCHKRIYLDDCPFHDVNKKIEEKTGFLINDQNVELYGICKECREKDKHN